MTGDTEHSKVYYSHWLELEKMLSTLAKENNAIRWVTNTGNAGDALIASATWQIFDELSIVPRVSRTRQVSKGDVAIFSGGGNLVSQYRSCMRFLERCLAVNVKNALVLPHTVRGHEALLNRLDERFIIVCRDGPSIDWIRRHAPNARTCFAPDLALRLDIPRLFASCDLSSNKVRFILRNAASPILIKYMLWRAAISRIQPVDGLLTVLRTDIEAIDRQNARKEQDLSNLYGSHFRQRLECDFISRDFLKVLDKAVSVRTNRLHVGLGSLLLGKHVELTDNNYGKIKAVFDSSLTKYPNVRFVGGG
jgi:exopolysaccharide biosynthesis predicted pyruvyltransferase EpsI